MTFGRVFKKAVTERNTGAAFSWAQVRDLLSNHERMLNCTTDDRPAVRFRYRGEVIPSDDCVKLRDDQTGRVALWQHWAG